MTRKTALALICSYFFMPLCAMQPSDEEHESYSSSHSYCSDLESDSSYSEEEEEDAENLISLIDTTSINDINQTHNKQLLFIVRVIETLKHSRPKYLDLETGKKITSSLALVKTILHFFPQNDELIKRLLFWAAAGGNKETLIFLIEELDISLNTPLIDHSQSTLLEVAAYYGQEEVIKWLLDEKNVDCTAPVNNHGQVALHAAAAGGIVSTIELLIGYEATVDACDADGYTPAHMAALYTREDALRHLLRIGASPHSQTNAGDRLLTLAEYNAHGIRSGAIERFIRLAQQQFSQSVTHL